MRREWLTDPHFVVPIRSTKGHDPPSQGSKRENPVKEIKKRESSI
jgi:hypothetical protein